MESSGHSSRSGCLSSLARAPLEWLGYLRIRRDEGRHEVDTRYRKRGLADQFTHSPDYRTVSVRGETFSLTSRQAQVMEILHKAYEGGNPDVAIHHILEALETKASRWQDTFKSNPRAKKALLVGGARKGTLRLKL